MMCYWENDWWCAIENCKHWTAFFLRFAKKKNAQQTNAWIDFDAFVLVYALKPKEVIKIEWLNEQSCTQIRKKTKIRIEVCILMHSP